MRGWTLGKTLYSVHPAAWALLAGGILLGHGLPLAAYLVALACHEGGHALAAAWLGCRVSEMELTPFGGAARVEDLQGASFAHQLLIAGAGPLASLLGFGGALALLSWLPVPWYPWLMALLKANLFLLALNLLPVLPLDGGRMLFALAAPRWGVQRGAKWLSLAGIWAGFGLTGLGLWAALEWEIYNLTAVLTGCYLAYAARLSARALLSQCIHGMIEKRVRLERRGQLPVKWAAVSGDWTVRRLYQLLEPGVYHRVLVISPRDFALLGEIDEHQLQNALLENENESLAAVCLAKPRGKVLQ